MHTIVQPDGWKPPKGYANAVLAEGRTLFLGGQIGWNGDQVFETHDFIGQMEQALRNIVALVEAAGGRTSDIVRLTWFVTDKKEYVARQREVGEGQEPAEPGFWLVEQILDDPQGDHDWRIFAEVDLAASDAAGELVLHATDLARA